MKILKIKFPVFQARNDISLDDDDTLLEAFLRGGSIPECVSALVEYESSRGDKRKEYFEHDGARCGTECRFASIRKAIAEAKSDPEQVQALRESLQCMERGFGKNRTRQKAIAFRNAAVKFFESGASQEEAVEIMKEAFVQAAQES